MELKYIGDNIGGDAGRIPKPIKEAKNLIRHVDIHIPKFSNQHPVFIKRKREIPTKLKLIVTNRRFEVNGFFKIDIEQLTARNAENALPVRFRNWTEVHEMPLHKPIPFRQPKTRKRVLPSHTRAERHYYT